MSNSHVPGLSFLDARESVSAFLAPRGWGDEVAVDAPAVPAEPVDASGDILLEVRLKDVDRVVGGQVPALQGVAMFTMVGMVGDGREVRLEVPVGDYVEKLLAEVNSLKEKAQDVEIAHEEERTAWEDEKGMMELRVRDAEAFADVQREISEMREDVGEVEDGGDFSRLGDRGAVRGEGDDGKRKKEKAGRAALPPRARMGAKKTSWGLLGAIGSPRRVGKKKDDAESRHSPVAVVSNRDLENLQENVPELFPESPLSSEEDTNEGSTYGAWEGKAWCRDGGAYDNVRSYQRRL